LKQSNITNDNTFVSSTEIINQVSYQHTDSNNIVNLYLDLDTKSDFYDNDKQTNVRTNETLNSSVVDTELETILDTVLQAESSITYPQIIENTECQINMTVLQKSMDSTANDSSNTSILQKSSEHSVIARKAIYIYMSIKYNKY